MNVAIVDDEVDARSTLKFYLNQFQPDWILHEADSVANGLTLVQTKKPDLVFLDVMMRDGTGFDLLKQLPSISFKLVIISGHQEFALQAFRFSAIDYLIKPVDTDELRETLARITTASDQPWSKIMDVLKQAIQPAPVSDRKIVLKDLNAVYVVPVVSIVRCEASDNYTTFYLSDQEPIIVSRPLKEYDDLLSAMNFLRVHQSHLVNLNYLKQFNKREGGSLTLKDGSEVPVSSRRRDILLDVISKFS